jgi:hypothetical protein
MGSPQNKKSYKPAELNDSNSSVSDDEDELEEKNS